jgi:hypothetical protein
MDNKSYITPSDTPRHIMDMQIAIVMKKTPLERLKMGTDMIDFGYEMLKRQIKADNKNIPDNLLKFEIVKALYADCFEEEEMARIEKHFSSQ